MGTIGVSRGFGDHSLLAHGDETRIKPFLSCIPEVRALHCTTFGNIPLL